MIIEIHPDKKLKDISKSFSHVYPYLKLEFFSKHHQWQESTSKHHILNQDLSVSEVTGNNHLSGYIEIHYWQKTGIVELNFQKQFNLSVQIYRKYDDHWVQSSGTDELTLEEQNESGMMAAAEHVGYRSAPDAEKKYL